MSNVRTYVSAKILSHHKLTNMDYNKYFYTPRTLFTMGLVLGMLFTYSFGGDALKESTKSYYYDEKNPDIFEDFRFPILFGCLTAIAFASTHFPDSFIKRPHPVFWRILLGVMLCYSTFMTIVFMLPRDKARWVFKIFHPSFGNEMPERDYASDCRVFTPENPHS